MSRYAVRRIVDALHAQLDEQPPPRAGALSSRAPRCRSPFTMLCFLGRIDDEFDSITGYLPHLDIISAIPFLGAALLGVTRTVTR